MRIALEFLNRIFQLLSADECMLGWRDFCSKGKKIVAAALNQLFAEALLLAKNPELLNVTKYCIEGSDMLRSIADIWDLASGVAEENEGRSFTAAFHRDTAVGAVFKDFVGSEPTNSSSSRRWKNTEEFRTAAEQIIETEAEKGHVTDFDRNEYFTYVQKDRVLEMYPEDFTNGEEPTWWVMGSSTQNSGSKAHRLVLNMDSKLLAGHTRSREQRVDGHQPTIPTRLTTRSSTPSSE